LLLNSHLVHAPRAISPYYCSAIVHYLIGMW
jgi:hypothetical protein